MTSTKSQQHLLLLSPGTDLAKVREAIEQKGGRITHRFGHEALVVELNIDETKAPRWLPAGARFLRDRDKIPASVSASAGEQMRAFRRRNLPEYRERRVAKVRDELPMHQWGTGDLPIPDLPEALGPFEHAGDYIYSPTEDALPTNERLINEVAVGVVRVSGRGDYELSPIEKEHIIQEVQEGLDWLGAQEPDAKITWAYDIQDVTVDFTPWEGARWPGVSQDFYKWVNAALYREDNGEIYLFSGGQYARFHMEDGKPVHEATKPIAGNWPGLPAEFEAGIDAALWRCSNDKIYLFKGPQYARFSTAGNQLTYETTKPIAGNWPGLPAAFEAGIDAALMDRNGSKIYFFKGNQFVRFSNVSAGVDSGYPQPIANFCPGLPDSYEGGIDAAVQSGDGKTYLFKGAGDVGTYVQISDLSVGVDPGFEWGQPVGLTNVEAELLWRAPAMHQLGYGPGDEGLKKYNLDLRAKLDTQWAFLGFYTKCPNTCGAYANKPPARIVIRYDHFIPLEEEGGAWWTEDADRYIAHETAHIFGAADEYLDSPCKCGEKKGEFFKHPNLNCFRCSPNNVPELPCLMGGDARTACEHTRWHLGWGAFMTKIDAAVWRGDNHKIYLFSNDQYIQYTDVAAGRDEGYPRKISGTWPDLPPEFRGGIDAALYRHDNKKVYLFKGDLNVRYSTSGNELTHDVTHHIADDWPGLPAGFKDGIDAAFWRRSDGRVYFFKGKRYVRFKLVDGQPVYEYTRPIAGNWPGLPARFEAGIDAALMHWSDGKIYFFKGNRYLQYLDEEDHALGGVLYINDTWMPFPK